VSLTSVFLTAQVRRKVTELPVPVTAVLLAATLGGLAGCSSEPSSSSSSPQNQSGGLGHIHGVGVDPGDGAVYIASHLGLFRVKDDEPPARVGPARDVMGFTVTGPGAFLASGHPGMEERTDPPHLGLVASDDAGQTWTHISEAGRADFHALATAGPTLYTFDSLSERVRRSVDGGKTWVVGSRLPALDLAAHPSKPDQVWAATTSGVQRSSDGGQTFTPVAGSPPLVAIEQPASELLTGVLASGEVLRASTKDTKWTRAGSVPGEPVTAFGVAGERTLLVATMQGVYRSDDAGATFRLLSGTAA